MDAGILADMSLRRLFCDFLAGSLLTVMARGEDQIKPQVSATVRETPGLAAKLIFLAATLFGCTQVQR